MRRIFFSDCWRRATAIRTTTNGDTTMLVLRNATENDLDGVFELAIGAGSGMTTLKADRAALRTRLAVAAASFAGDMPLSHADYLFVLEDLENCRLCGVSAIKGAVGVTEPFYSYRVSTSVHASPHAGMVNRFQSLHLTHDLAGASELCSLYLHPDYRNGLNGKLLSKGRFLFLVQFPGLFSQTVIAEMRGYQDGQGRSPFWEAVGRPFFQMDFHEADDKCGQGDRLFIEQLVPRLPLYTHLLSEAARAAIGKTHSHTVPARRLLEQEGLHFDGHIDIFDGGPVLQARYRDLRAVRESQLRIVRAGAADGASPSLVATARQHHFRVIATDVDGQAGFVRLEQTALSALECDAGAPVRILAMQGTVQGSETGTGSLAVRQDG
jgi:arginine N-succinyltransferase